MLNTAKGVSQSKASILIGMHLVILKKVSASVLEKDKDGDRKFSVLGEIFPSSNCREIWKQLGLILKNNTHLEWILHNIEKYSFSNVSHTCFSFSDYQIFLVFEMSVGGKKTCFYLLQSWQRPNLSLSLTG